MPIATLFRMLALAAGASVAASPASAQNFEVFASHMFFVDGLNTANQTCYLSNVGKKPVRVKQPRLIDEIGNTVALAANTCGSASGFDLGPGSTCYIAANRTGGLFACSAKVDRADQMRGSLEMRDAAGATLGRAALSAESGANDATTFEALASPPTFKSQQQNEVICVVTNFGATPARLKQRQFLTSTGDAVAIHDTCRGVLEPGRSCRLNGSGYDPVSDRQCRMLVTRKAKLRGWLFYGTRGGSFSWAPMQ